ncbi:hypothetical protein [Flavobacterium sp. WC2509]|uniref:hypothetical protein n=1 Tax=Flavobacterium sp. WC2509 TaxID=3461406 RepID=UPI004043F941
MKNINLCYITLVLFSCMSVINSYANNTSTPMIASHSICLGQTKTAPIIDPDWTKLVTSFNATLDSVHSTVK